MFALGAGPPWPEPKASSHPCELQVTQLGLAVGGGLAVPRRLRCSVLLMQERRLSGLPLRGTAIVTPSGQHCPKAAELSARLPLLAGRESNCFCLWLCLVLWDVSVAGTRKVNARNMARPCFMEFVLLNGKKDAPHLFFHIICRFFYRQA